jgi:hypothetical protein
MSPILLGLAVTCWRVRQRPLQRMAVRVAGIDVEVPAA